MLYDGPEAVQAARDRAAVEGVLGTDGKEKTEPGEHVEEVARR